MDMYDIAVTGGGASGLLAAVAASASGGGRLKICILERMDRVGKKLLATGNGRCNITNMHDDDSHFHGQNREMIRSVLGRFGCRDTIAFFENIGLLCREEEQGRVYPYSMQASAVLDVLRNTVQHRGIAEICGFDAASIQKHGEIFIIRSSKNEEIRARKVILATGGQAAPNLGSNGSGYALARAFGHSLIRPFPALVQIKSDNPNAKSLDGIRVICEVKAMLDGTVVHREAGEVQFTKYGLSGIPIMQASRFYGGRKAVEKMTVSLDLMPGYAHDGIQKLLKSRRDSGAYVTLETFLVGMINKKIGYAVLKNANLIPLSRNTSTLSDRQLSEIAAQIKDFSFAITGAMSWENAQVTAGGLDSGEFSSDTLESLKVKGLYAAGELLDVYGDCGGYNLQWAWATGVISGRAAGKALPGK